MVERLIQLHKFQAFSRGNFIHKKKQNKISNLKSQYDLTGNAYKNCFLLLHTMFVIDSKILMRLSL